MATKEILDTIEETLDVLDETIDVMEKTGNEVITLTKNNPIVIGVVAVVALSSGVTAGYFLAKRLLTTKYDKILSEEIAEAKKFYSALHKKGNFETPESTVENLGLVEDAVEAMSTYQGEDEDEDNDIRLANGLPVKEKIQVVNVFDEAKTQEDENFNYEEELKQRTNMTPYVISHDEYMEAAVDYNQIQLTYFAGDEVLSDEKDKPIDDVDKTIGSENLERFGHGSKDKNIVYVRNDQMDLDFEIVLNQGKYVEEVLGFIEHGDRRRKIRKFRGDDE